ncbi:YbjO family protein [Atlantibacter subterraneus]|uniref:YbjO family protein n=1 Tax=Atlantibacter subterraneus TaxID=255519 RepID=UPI0029651E52|nr:YbjO family protein [Atlantibacter subterranea]MDW2742066.1 YbjO family protein [Atlantibacter subterranea]
MIFTRSHHNHARLNVPTLVYIAAIAIITTRCVDLLMVFNMLGVRGAMDFIHRSVQTWSLTLVFLSSLLLLCIEFRCAFAIIKGRNWGRWIYLLSQIAASGYLWAASLGWGYPELFSIAGETKREILHSLVMHKTPDIMILVLLFLPVQSRRFFQLQ